MQFPCHFGLRADIGERSVLEDLPVAMFDLTYSPDGKFLATAGGARANYLWDTHSWKVARKITGQSETINVIRFSPDGPRIVRRLTVPNRRSPTKR